jgi:predicted thioesterase
MADAPPEDGTTKAQGSALRGAEATVEQRVDDTMTARALGSGEVDVLGTPAVLALAERAACEALAGRLGDAETTVGTHVELTHRAPTVVGSVLTASARLVAVEGPRVTFELEIADEAGPVASGRHHRVVVRRDEFLDRATGRSGRTHAPEGGSDAASPAEGTRH